jgi:hypothetical protein
VAFVRNVGSACVLPAQNLFQDLFGAGDRFTQATAERLLATAVSGLPHRAAGGQLVGVLDAATARCLLLALPTRYSASRIRRSATLLEPSSSRRICRSMRAAQLPGIGIRRQRPFPSAVRKAVATHQKARADGSFLDRLDPFDGVEHFRHAGTALRRTQPRQQAALEVCALLPQAVKLAVPPDGWAGTTGWAYAQVGKEEIGRPIRVPGRVPPAVLDRGQEFQGLVGLAADQVIQVVAKAGQRSCQLDRRLRCTAAPCFSIASSRTPALR